MTEQAKAPLVKKLNLKRRFVADGVFQAELNDFFMRHIAEEGYCGLEIRVTNQFTEIRIRATKTKEIIGEKSQRLNALTALISKRFGYDEATNKVTINVKSVERRGLSAHAQAESIKHKLMLGFPVRVVAHSALRYIMSNNAIGAEIRVSGKLRGERAKDAYYRAGYRVSTGQPKIDYSDIAVRHVGLKQGIVGVKVTIMIPYNLGVEGIPNKPLPDVIEMVGDKPIIPA